MKSILFLFVFLLVSTYAEHEGVNWAAIHANNQAGQFINALNYLLSTEQLNAWFLRTGLSRFTPEQINGVGALTSADVEESYYAAIQRMVAQGDEHIAQLREWIRIVGNTYNQQLSEGERENNDIGQEVVVAGPVEPCEYRFPEGLSVSNFSRLAHDMMMTEESAYIGIFSHQGFLNGQTILEGEGDIQNRQNNFEVLGRLMMLLAGIEATHARHTAYLAQQNRLHPFPNAVEPAIDARTTFQRQTPFIVSCPYDSERLYNLVDAQAVANTGGGPQTFERAAAGALSNALALLVPSGFLLLSLF